MDIKVSVIIPTYGGNQSLKRAIDSVLQQDFESFEVIVVDDNDNGTRQRADTEKIMAEYQNNESVIYLQHEKNKNGSAARNTGARIARGIYLTFLDDDDVYLQGKLNKEAKYLDTFSQYDAVYCWRKERGENIGSRQTGDLSLSLLDLSFTPCTPSLMLRKEVYFEINGFDESYYRHQDFEFLLRFFEKHSIGVIEDVLIEIIGNEVDNQPRGEKAVALKRKFLDTFSDNINKLDKKNKGFKKRVYANHYAPLMVKLLRYGNFKLAIKTYLSDAYKGGLQFWIAFFLQIHLIAKKRISSLKKRRNNVRSD